MTTLTKPHSRAAAAPGGGSSPVATAELAAALERTLDGLIAHHARLTDLARAQREAVRAADAAAIETITRDQHAALRSLAALDQQRAELTEQLAARLPAARAGSAGAPGVTITALAAALPGKPGHRLRELGLSLRSAIEALRREQAVVAAATETVLSHLDGVMRQVAGRVAALSPAGAAATYGRAGAVPVAVSAAIDMTS